MRLTAQEIYNKLINEDKILTLKGQINFYLGDVNIIVKQKDVVGNIMQEWLQGWMDSNNIEYAPDTNSQMPPDFYLNPDDKTKNLLEVKAFNRSKTPAFDIADFRMYASEILEKPYMLNVDYLIFGYDMSIDGVVTIKDIWLKKSGKLPDAWKIILLTSKSKMALFIKYVQAFGILISLKIIKCLILWKILFLQWRKQHSKNRN